MYWLLKYLKYTIVVLVVHKRIIITLSVIDTGCYDDRKFKQVYVTLYCCYDAVRNVVESNYTIYLL